MSAAEKRRAAMSTTGVKGHGKSKERASAHLHRDGDGDVLQLALGTGQEVKGVSDAIRDQHVGRDLVYHDLRQRRVARGRAQ